VLITKTSKIIHKQLTSLISKCLYENLLIVQMIITVLNFISIHCIPDQGYLFDLNMSLKTDVFP